MFLPVFTCICQKVYPQGMHTLEIGKLSFYLLGPRSVWTNIHVLNQRNSDKFHWKSVHPPINKLRILTIMGQQYVNDFNTIALLFWGVYFLIQHYTSILLGCIRPEVFRDDRGLRWMRSRGMAVSLVGFTVISLGYTIYFAIYLVGCPGVESLYI